MAISDIMDSYGSNVSRAVSLIHSGKMVEETQPQLARAMYQKAEDFLDHLLYSFSIPRELKMNLKAYYDCIVDGYKKIESYRDKPECTPEDFRDILVVWGFGSTAQIQQ